LGTSQQLAKITSEMSRCCPLWLQSSTRYVIPASSLTVNCACSWTRMLPLSAVAAITSCGNYIRSLLTKAAETLVHALVSSRLDYCNALLYGVTDGLQYRRLQSVQNAASRLVSGLRCRDHIRPTLLRLHWLPVRQRVLFKIAVVVYQCLNGLAPRYLADNCQLVSDVRPRQLRSSDSSSIQGASLHNSPPALFISLIT